MNNFPNLQIIPTNKAILHEETDPSRVKRLMARLVKEKYILDPVIVAPLKNGNFVVLDGANRTTAFQKLKIPHLLVQVLDYKSSQVKLQTWNHLICNPGFKKYYSGATKKFNLGDIAEMSAFVNCYKPKYEYHRVIGHDFKVLKGEFPNLTCLVTFPKFKPTDIEKYALTNQKIPSGITRHIINGRALRVRVPLDILKSAATTEQKNRWLKKYLLSLNQENHVRFYAEPVFLYDE